MVNDGLSVINDAAEEDNKGAGLVPSLSHLTVASLVFEQGRNLAHVTEATAVSTDVHLSPELTLRHLNIVMSTN